MEEEPFTLKFVLYRRLTNLLDFCKVPKDLQHSIASLALREPFSSDQLLTLATASDHSLLPGAISWTKDGIVQCIRGSHADAISYRSDHDPIANPIALAHPTPRHHASCGDAAIVAVSTNTTQTPPPSDTVTRFPASFLPSTPVFERGSYADAIKRSHPISRTGAEAVAGRSTDLQRPRAAEMVKCGQACSTSSRQNLHGEYSSSASRTSPRSIYAMQPSLQIFITFRPDCSFDTKDVAGYFRLKGESCSVGAFCGCGVERDSSM